MANTRFLKTPGVGQKEVADFLTPQARATFQRVADELDSIIFTEVFLDCQATDVAVHTRDDNSGAGRAAGTVLAASFGGVQPDQLRTVQITAASMGAVADRVVVINGVSRGVTATESIVVAGNAETVQGTRAWDTITSIDFPAIPIGGSLKVGLGPRLGLSNLIQAGSNVLKITKGGVNQTVSGVNAANATIALTIAGGDDFKVWYRLGK